MYFCMDHLRFLGHKGKLLSGKYSRLCSHKDIGLHSFQTNLSSEGILSKDLEMPVRQKVGRKEIRAADWM